MISLSRNVLIFLLAAVVLSGPAPPVAVAAPVLPTHPRPLGASHLQPSPFFSALSAVGAVPLWSGERIAPAPRHRPFLVARRSRVPVVLPWRPAAAARRRSPPAWPNAAAVHGKDVHWPSLRRDGFMLHHSEVNRGHHHHLDFGTQPAENGLIDIMML